jgi:transcriptional regulator with XRE-family HTH domain
MTPAEFRAARLSLGLTQAQLAAVMGYAAYNRVRHRGWAT